MEQKKNYTHAIFILLLVIAAVMIAAILKITASVLLPLTIAMLISLVFEPILLKMQQKFKIPWGIGIIFVFLIVVIALYIISSLVFASVKTILSLYPKYEERFLVIYSTIADIFSLPFNEQNSLFENLWSQLSIRTAVQDFALSFSSKVITYAKDFVMICLFAAFFLIEMKYIRQKIDYSVEIIPKTDDDISEKKTTEEKKTRITVIIKDIIEQVTSYISIKFFISLLTGILVFICMLAIRLDFPIVWAFLAFVFNFIPTFGSIASVLLTTIFALVQYWPSPLPVILTFAAMTLINFILGNIIEPRVQGRNLGLSPFVIIASLSVWGWLWGFAGLVLGVPMMVIVKIICENFSILKPVSILLGSWPPTDRQ